MAARAYSGKKPKNLKHTLRVFLSYLGRHKKMLAVVAVLVTISAGANLLGTYMIRPVVNGLADGDVHTLLRGVLITALIFGCGALAAYGYTQTMVKAAQQVVYDIRRDLFEHVQTLPLQFFDSRRHGDIMSLFTNDIGCPEQQLCDGHSELYPDCGNIDLAVYPELAALPDCNGVLWHYVLVYQIQRKTK